MLFNLHQMHYISRRSSVIFPNISVLFQEVQRKNEKIEVLIEKFRNMIQDLNLIVQLETSQ